MIVRLHLMSHVTKIVNQLGEQPACGHCVMSHHARQQQYSRGGLQAMEPSTISFAELNAAAASRASGSAEPVPPVSPVPSLPLSDPPRLSRKRRFAATLQPISFSAQPPPAQQKSWRKIDIQSDSDSQGSSSDSGDETKRNRFDSVESISSQSSIASSLGYETPASPSPIYVESGSQSFTPFSSQSLVVETTNDDTAYTTTCPYPSQHDFLSSDSAIRVTRVSVPSTASGGRQSGVAPRPTTRILIGGKRPGEKRGPALMPGSMVGEYKIIGAGKDARAINVETQQVMTAQVITRSELDTLMAVSARLDQANVYCRDTLWDIDELCEMVIPSTCMVVEEPGRIVFFSPIHEGSLHMHAHDKNLKLPEADMCVIFNEIVRLLAFCHECGIILRDLKPRKLVFTSESTKRLRLSDVFDCAVCETPDKDIVREKFGSPAYVPPEVLSQGNSGFAGRPADMWGLGVLTYLLLLGKYPFFDSTPVGLFKKIKRGNISIPSQANLSLTARLILLNLLRHSPENRPSAKFLLTVPWTVPSTRQPVCVFTRPPASNGATLAPQAPIASSALPTLLRQAAAELRQSSPAPSAGARNTSAIQASGFGHLPPLPGQAPSAVDITQRVLFNNMRQLMTAFRSSEDVGEQEMPGVARPVARRIDNTLRMIGESTGYSIEPTRIFSERVQTMANVALFQVPDYEDLSAIDGSIDSTVDLEARRALIYLFQQSSTSGSAAE